ncbi:MAG: polysaccharide biosynthesis C-terminal domain-containing protein [Calditrichota bacterium]
MQRLPRKLLASMAGQIGVFVGGLLSQVIIARSFGTEGKGAFTLSVLVVTVVFNLVNGSLGAANAHYLGRRSAWGGAILGNSIIQAVLIGSLVIIASLTLAEGMLPHIYPELDVALVKRLMLIMPFLLIMEYTLQMVIGQDRILRFNVLLFMRDFIFLAALVLLLIGGYLTVISALAAWAATQIISSLWSLWSAWEGGRYRFKIDWQVWTSMARYALQTYSANLFAFLRSRLEMLIIPFYLDLSSLGVFSVAISVSVVLWQLPTAVSQVLLPFISIRNDQAANLVTPTLCRITLFLTTIAAIIIVIVGLPGISWLFGRDFSPAFKPLAIILPGTVINSLAKLLSGDLAGRGKAHYAAIISPIVVALSLALNLTLIPLWGLTGAALTSSFILCLQGILFLAAFQRESDIPLNKTVFIQKDDLRTFKLAFKALLNPK